MNWIVHEFLYFTLQLIKIMFILSSISCSIEFWSVNFTSIYENSELKVFKVITFLGEICNNWSNDLFGTNVCRSLESCWWSLLKILQWTNTILVISKWDIFSPFPHNFFASSFKSFRVISYLYFKHSFSNFFLFYLCIFL